MIQLTHCIPFIYHSRTREDGSPNGKKTKSSQHVGSGTEKINNLRKR